MRGGEIVCIFLRFRKNDEFKIYIGQVIFEEYSLFQYFFFYFLFKMLFYVYFSKFLLLCILFCFSVFVFFGFFKLIFLDDFQKNKNGIYVFTEIDFGKVELGGRKKLIVWIQNKGEIN